MGFFDEFATDDISYWAASDPKDAYAKPTFASPIILKGRWEDKSEIITDATGREIVARSRIWFLQSVSLGDYIMLGTFSSGDTDPTIVSGASEIMDVRKVKDIEGIEEEVIAFLA